MRVEAVNYNGQYGLNMLAQTADGIWKLVGYGQRDKAEAPSFINTFVVTNKDGIEYPIPLTENIKVSNGIRLEGENDLVQLAVNVSLPENGNPILDLELTRKGTAELGKFYANFAFTGASYDKPLDPHEYMNGGAWHKSEKAETAYGEVDRSHHWFRHVRWPATMVQKESDTFAVIIHPSMIGLRGETIQNAFNLICWKDGRIQIECVERNLLPLDKWATEFIEGPPPPVNYSKPGGTAKFSFILYANATSPPYLGYRKVYDIVRDLYIKHTPEPPVYVPLSKTMKELDLWLFNRFYKYIWRNVDQDKGGFVYFCYFGTGHVETTRLWEDSVCYNWGFNNNLIGAYGFQRYYEMTGDEKYRIHARKVVDLLIKTDSMITEGPLAGAFRTCWDDDPLPFRSESNWKGGDMWWVGEEIGHEEGMQMTTVDENYTGFNAPIVPKEGYWFVDLLRSVNMAVTGYYLLDYADMTDYQPATDYAQKLGEFFLREQMPDGDWMGMWNPKSDYWDWVKEHGHEKELNNIIEGNKSQCGDALVVWFLTRLYESTHDKRYLAAAVKGMDHLYKHHILTNDYYGTEFYPGFTTGGLMDSKAPFSCFLAGMELFKVTGERKYADWAEISGDYMLLFSYCYDNPSLGENHKYGWTDCDASAEGVDHRGAWFAQDLMKYYTLTGNRKYFEDAIGMIRAWAQGQAIPEVPMMKNSPDRDRMPDHVWGLFPESHNGGPYTITGGSVDVGEGNTHFIATLADVFMKYGGLYVNTKYGHAFGIDAIDVIKQKVDSRSAELTIKNLCPTKHEIDLQTDKLIEYVEVDGKPWPNWSHTRVKSIPVSGTHKIKVIFSKGMGAKRGS
ncbi:MAG: hypothetical protein WCO51_01095 [bacterium]